MSKDQEIFRVFINSVQKARDPAKEQREIMLVQNTMNTVLGQLSEQDRLYYSLEVDPGKLDQWLVVSCCDSLQRRLFEDRKAPYSASSTEDPLLAGTVMQATNALKHLRTLSTSTGLSPDDFIDAIRTTAPALIRLLTDRGRNHELPDQRWRDYLCGSNLPIAKNNASRPRLRSLSCRHGRSRESCY